MRALLNPVHNQGSTRRKIAAEKQAYAEGSAAVDARHGTSRRGALKRLVAARQRAAAEAAAAAAQASGCPGERVERTYSQELRAIGIDEAVDLETSQGGGSNLGAGLGLPLKLTCSCRRIYRFYTCEPPSSLDI